MFRTIAHAAIAALVILSFGPVAAPATASPNAVDQYTEQVPTVGGERPSNDPRPNPDATPEETQGATEEEGGTEAGLLPGGGSGPGADSKGKPSRNVDSAPGQRSGREATAQRSSGSLPGSLFSGVSDESSGGRMGALFPVAMIVTLLLAVGVMIIRYRRDGHDPVAR